jgi:hypothetical protein
MAWEIKICWWATIGHLVPLELNEAVSNHAGTTYSTIWLFDREVVLMTP